MASTFVVVPPPLIVIVLLDIVTEAPGAVLLWIPRINTGWFTPDPLLLLIVLCEILIPYWLRVRIPLEGFAAAVPPPKLMIVLPVPAEAPPTSLFVSPLV